MNTSVPQHVSAEEILMGRPEENKAKLEQMGAIQAECVGRIIVAAEQFPSIVEAMQTTLEAYRISKLGR